jgi:hypothetical protein
MPPFLRHSVFLLFRLCFQTPVFETPYILTFEMTFPDPLLDPVFLFYIETPLCETPCIFHSRFETPCICDDVGRSIEAKFFLTPPYQVEVLVVFLRQPQLSLGPFRLPQPPGVLLQLPVSREVAAWRWKFLTTLCFFLPLIQPFFQLVFLNQDEQITSLRHPGVWHAVCNLHPLLNSFLSRYYSAIHGLLTSLFPNYHLLERGFLHFDNISLPLGVTIPWPQG